MVDAALRARVERLLKGDVRVEDLTTLFLAMRDRSGGRETVREIGDFAAHRDERNKGITTRAVRDFFTYLRVRGPNLGKNIDLTNLPPNIMDVLYAGFRQLDSAVIKKETGLRRPAVERVLEGIAGKLKSDAGGKLFIAWPTTQEAEVMDCVTRWLSPKPAFDDVRLLDEFCGALTDNDLLGRKELPAFRKLKNAVTMYAVSIMHLSEIDLGDGTTASLHAMPDTGRGMIGINATAAVANLTLGTGILAKGGSALISTTMFLTSLKATDCCEPDLMAELRGFPTWHCHIEMTGVQKLAKLV